MSTCSILIPGTKEPRIFYKSNSGEVFSSLYDVLNNTDSSYEMGFKDAAEVFQSKAVIPVYSKDTQEGRIQSYIKNGYLTGRQTAPNTFEATDSYAAEILESELILDHYKEYKRTGTSFEFGDFKIDISTFPESYRLESEAVEIYRSIQNERKEKPVKYNELQLKSMIESFMKKVGFSTTSIEKYKKSYSNKFGVEPDAEVFIDLQRKIIATLNGEITLDQLTEEFSHFVIESWNQDEIQRMLQSVNNTKEYLENAETYRQIYSKQISDPVLLEEAVRREVLGKMLGNSLQKDFTLENKSETEVNFFQKLSQIVRDFLNFFKRNLTPSLQQQVDAMAEDIQNKLYNENLEKSLNMDQSPILTLMYSINRETEELINTLTKNVMGNYNSDLEKQVDELFNTALSTAVASNSKINELEKDEILPAELVGNIEVLLGMEDLVSKVLSRFKRLKADEIGNTSIAGYSPERILKFRNQIVAKGIRTLSEISEMKGTYKDMRENHDGEIILKNMIEKYENKTAEQIEQMVSSAAYGLKKDQQDTSWFTNFFMSTNKMSNLFVRQLSIIVASMNNAQKDANIKSIEKFITPLKQYREKIKDFMKDGYFRSGANNRKIEEETRKYELSILKQVYSGYENMEMDEYNEMYQLHGIKELKTKDLSYYKYTYLYDKSLKDTKFTDTKFRKRKEEFIEKIDNMELGEEPWRDLFYISQTDLSNQRGKDQYRLMSEKQKSEASPYDDTGNLKSGFSIMFYGEAKKKYKGTEFEKQVVSTNPRHEIFQGAEPDSRDLVFFFDKSNTDEYGKLAYNHTLWKNQNMTYQLSKNKDVDKKTARAQTKENFKKEYESVLRKLDKEGLTDVQRGKKLREWLNNSLMFEATEEYWSNFGNGGGIDFESFNTSASVSSGDRANMDRHERNYKELSLKKQLILKRYKNQNDYKEVDIKSISQVDKSMLEDLDLEMREIMYATKEDANGDPILSIKDLFDMYDMGDDIYKSSTSDSTANLNIAARELFEETTGVNIDNAEIKHFEAFFQGAGVSRNAVKYSNLKKDLQSGKDSPTVEMYRDRTRSLKMDSSDNTEVLKAFFISNAPSWYKRYDANEDYDSFIKDYHNGKINTEEMIKSYLNSNEDQVIYTNPKTGVTNVLSSMQITPSMKFSLPFDEKIDDLYEDYKVATTDVDKYDILQKMGGIENVDPEYKVDMSDIRNNAENLKAYILMMDLRLEILDKDQKMERQYVFLMPQQRITNYERIEALMKNKDKWGQTKDYFQEMMSFRADDFEESYKSYRIPVYGYYRLKPEELTSDVLHSLVWGMSNANMYDQRFKHRADADSMLRAIENQKFDKGQKPTDTNYFKIAQEMFDFNIHGKTVSKKIEVSLPGGKTIDLSKLLFGLKNFGVVQALALSPVVAATNLISGATQVGLNHMVGRKLHKASNTRALRSLTKMFPASLGDIGKFDPEAKINKIMYAFGSYDLDARYENTKYNRIMRLLPQIGFSMMAITNFPLEAQTVLTKLMEYRLIDGQFISWRQYMITEKTKNPQISNTELSRNFDQFKQKSMYDFLDNQGKFNEEALTKEGYKGDIDKDKVMVMGIIRSMTEMATMEIASYNEGAGGRNPLASFVLTLKKWMVLSTSIMFSNRRMDIDGEEEGLIYTPQYIYKMFKTALKDKKTFRESYQELDDVERMNIKTSASLAAMLTVMFTIAMLLKGLADDDDNEDNYLIQLSAYMAMRGLNEAGSTNVMLPEAYFEAIQNPIMIGSTLQNVTNIFKFGNIGEEVQSGKYKGQDKYWSGILKATALKNPYTVSSADVIGQTRQSYEFFNSQNSLYHIFDLMPEKEKEE